MTKIEQIQTVLGVTVDGQWGPKSQAAMDAAVSPIGTITRHHGKASTFADPADVAAFKRCKAAGGTDQECFDKGDNGIGEWDDSTVEGTGPSCALPPEDLQEKWGGSEATRWIEARHKLVEVEANGKSVTCVVKDRMPHKANITNGAIIDLNPDASRALGIEPPDMFTASWRWLS